MMNAMTQDPVPGTVVGCETAELPRRRVTGPVHPAVPLGNLVRTALLTVLAVLAAVPLAAQIRPGVPRRDYWETERARYRDEVVEEIQGVLAGWQAAWNEDRAEELVDLYAGSAVLALGDREAWGKVDVRRRFDDILPAVGPITLSMTDFATGGELAYVFGTYSFDGEPGASTPERVSGRFAALFMRDGGRWVIRSQLFEVEPGPASSGS